MSYTPNTWQSGDIVTAEKLNNIEQGISDTETELAVTFSDPNDDGNIVITIGS